ncbi:MAG: hypothetical protein CVU38_11540 [Chloroflexi bacterium HGW-Chloroflexi-1]|nr:MAG: hypothetical protein CVU38_11540 [Chloroflexi bacterium HGW-Chloroflexi-1]
MTLVTAVSRKHHGILGPSALGTGAEGHEHIEAAFDAFEPTAAAQAAEVMTGDRRIRPEMKHFIDLGQQVPQHLIGGRPSPPEIQGPSDLHPVCAAPQPHPVQAALTRSLDTRRCAARTLRQRRGT